MWCTEKHKRIGIQRGLSAIFLFKYFLASLNFIKYNVINMYFLDAEKIVSEENGMNNITILLTGTHKKVIIQSKASVDIV